MINGLMSALGLFGTSFGPLQLSCNTAQNKVMSQNSTLFVTADVGVQLYKGNRKDRLH